MGFYNEHVLPRFVNVMLGNKEFANVRKEACAGLRGDVIELGFGSGLNLPHLPPEVTGIWTVAPRASACTWRRSGSPQHRSTCTSVA